MENAIERVTSMKRILSVFLVLALLTLPACGSGEDAGASQPQPSTDETTVPGEGPVTVSNMTQLLAAIAPDTEIVLEPGDYYLSDILGGETSSAYYSTQNGLVLTGVSNLTLRGSGQGRTNLLVEPRSFDVLTLQDCSNITLEGMSLGHTVEAEACEGGVVRLEGSKGVSLQDLDLYGCGTIGVQASNSEEIQVTGCVIHHCSFSGISLYYSQDITISDSTFHSLGVETPIFNVFDFAGCGDVTVSGCDISECYVETLLNTSASSGTITFRDNRFAQNRVSRAMLSLQDGGCLMEGNTFEENQARHWYLPGSAHAVDADGQELLFEDPDPAAGPVVTTPVSSGPQAEVHVSTADEFLDAIGPDTCIVLDTPLLDLSTAASYQEAEKLGDGEMFFGPGVEYYYWVNNFDGPSLVITSVPNLTIRADGSDRKAHTISATPRYANVLTFENCDAVTLSGFTAGHTKEPGYCMGGVIELRDCSNFLVDNCGLFGCGTIGVEASNVRDLQVVDSEIYECSFYGIRLDSCANVSISGTTIRDIGDESGPAPFYCLSGCQDVTLDGSPMDGNFCGN